ncbi:MAG: NUDIX domain-containing protein [Candidatus Sungbacteria bacterium]|uniref:Bis(5'-nucleosyl)-tetraphosphatase [asymmetrical] n=1 Tax=Candidatus Sungiibacteriota bacterium TaxID=2750080 RepID=A0A933DRM0_9BACT|nr:NUDIX domain-containing protein [Candidatus Sungbacteria bacterium]
MPVERSAGIIFFMPTPQGRRYLIVRSSRDLPDRPEFWDIPKGILEKGETKGIEAALRESREETQLENFSIVPGFKYTARYFTRRDGKSVPKFVAVFLAEAHDDSVKLSWEHDRYEWASFGEAMKRLTTMKPALQAAEDFLSHHRVSPLH